MRVSTPKAWARDTAAPRAMPTSTEFTSQGTPGVRSPQVAKPQWPQFEPLGLLARAHERHAEAFAHTVGVAQEKCEPALLADGLHGAGERFQIVAVHHGAFHDIDAFALGSRPRCHQHLLGDVQRLRLPNVPLVVNHAASLSSLSRLSCVSGSILLRQSPRMAEHEQALA